MIAEHRHIAVKFAAVTISLAYSLSASSQIQWDGQKEYSGILTTWIDCSDSANCLVIAKEHSLLNVFVSKTTDGGHSFESFYLPKNYYYDVPERVYFPSIDTAYIFALGQIFKSTDGGVTWDRIVAALDATGGYTAMSFRSPQHGIVATQMNTSSKYKNLFFRTEDGWQTWSRVRIGCTPCAGGAIPVAIHEFDNGRITVIWLDAETREHLVATLPEAGGEWEFNYIPVDDGLLMDYTAVSERVQFILFWQRDSGSSNIYSQMLRSSNYGKSWESVFDGFQGMVQIDHIAFRDSLNGLAPSNNNVYRTTDGGDTWRAEPYATAPDQFQRMVPSYPFGSDGVVLASKSANGRLYVANEVGGTADDRDQKWRFMDIRLAPTNSDAEYLLTFSSSYTLQTRIRLYDVLGFSLFETEFSATEGLNSVVITVPGVSSQVGFLQLSISNQSFVEPVILAK